MDHSTGLTLAGSGTRETLPDETRRTLAGLVQDAVEDHGIVKFISGACIGFDAWFGAFAATLWPEAEHLVIVPADRSRVDPWWLEFPRPVRVLHMPPETSYRARNLALVSGSHLLFAAPAAAERESRRSGTWMTIRMAREIHVQPPIVHPLNSI